MRRVGILGISCVDVIVNDFDGVPKPGELKLVSNTKMYTGGCALNAAIDYKKIGYDPVLITVVGNDSFGDYIIKTIDENEIDTKYVSKVNQSNTSSSIVLVNSSGERGFLHNPGVNKEFSLNDLDLSFLDEIDILFIAGTLVMNNFEENDLKELLKTAQEKGIFTVLDTVYDGSGRWGKVINPLLKYIDLFAPSIDEAAAIAQTNDLEEMVKIFKENGATNVLVKLGREGAYSNIDNQVNNYKSFNVTAKDTTGAGDAFMTGVMVGLANDWSTDKTMRFANAVGAHAVMEVGASSGVKNFTEIIKFIERDELDE